MMRSATAASTHESATSAAREAWSSLTAKMGRPDLLIVVATVGYDLTELVAELRSLAVGIPIQGGTSCGGVMTDEGFFGLEGRALGLLGLADEAAHFGVGVAPIGAAPREAGAGAVWNRLVSGGQEGRRVGRSARDP